MPRYCPFLAVPWSRHCRAELLFGFSADSPVRRDNITQQLFTKWKLDFLCSLPSGSLSPSSFSFASEELLFQSSIYDGKLDGAGDVGRDSDALNLSMKKNQNEEEQIKMTWSKTSLMSSLEMTETVNLNVILILMFPSEGREALDHGLDRSRMVL